MPLPYSHTTLSSARAQLAIRLQDPNNVYWAAGELNLYITEALRTYQALTGFYRERIAWTSVPSQPFYDLAIDPALQPANAAQVGYSVRDTDLLTQLEYHLLEPPTVPYSGTNQFSQSQLLQALQGRLDQFLVDTGCVVTHSLLPFPAPPTSRVLLPDSVIDIRRAAWLDSTTATTFPLWRTEEYSAEGFAPGWPQSPATPPLCYSVSVTPPVTLQIIPPPAAPGQLDLVTLNSGPALTGAGTLVTLPDDFTPALKWGALAELLGADGQARDEQRSVYSEQMYSLLSEACKLNPSVLQAQINAVPVFTGSLQEMDSFSPNWQVITSLPSPNPLASSFAGMAGRNLLALKPVISAKYGLSIDLSRNMPVPVLDGDFLQVGREEVDDILDFAQHLATFKSGGQEFQDTLPLRDNFLQMATLKNSRLRAASFAKLLLESPASKQDSSFPRVLEAQTQ